MSSMVVTDEQVHYLRELLAGRDDAIAKDLIAELPLTADDPVPACDECNDTGWVDNYVDGCAQNVPTSCPLLGIDGHPEQQPREGPDRPAGAL